MAGAKRAIKRHKALKREKGLARVNGLKQTALKRKTPLARAPLARTVDEPLSPEEIEERREKARERARERAAARRADHRVLVAAAAVKVAEGACRACGMRLELGRPGLTRHHLLPRSKGGGHVPENLIPLGMGPGTCDCHGLFESSGKWRRAVGMMIREAMLPDERRYLRERAGDSFVDRYYPSIGDAAPPERVFIAEQKGRASARNERVVAHVMRDGV